MKRVTIGFYSTFKSYSSEINKLVDHVYPFVDEIVIVIGDTQSNIHYNFGRKVTVIHEAFASFSDIRNIALHNLSTDWVFTLDSDERASHTLLKNLRRLTRQAQWCSYKLHRIHFYGSTKQVNDPFTHRRLFKKTSKVRYIGNVHELLINASPGKELQSWKSIIQHYNEADYNVWEEKRMKYLGILTNDLHYAISKKDQALIDVANFRIWNSNNLDRLDLLYNSTLLQKNLKIFKKNLRDLNKKYGDYHPILEQFDKK